MFNKYLIIILFSYFSLIISQSYGNLTYSVLGIVKSIHKLPHLDSNLKEISNNFNIERNQLHNDYTESVIVFPILLTCLLFISFSLFELSLCCRVCFSCCRCLDTIPIRDSINSMALWTEKVTKSRISLVRGFWCFAFLSLLACQGIIFSGIFLINGSNRGIDSANNLYDIAIDLEDSGENLDTSGNLVLDLTAQAVPTCPEANYVQNYADDFSTYVADYMSIIQPIPNDLNKMEDFLKEYGLSVASISIWATYSGVFVSIIFIILAYLSRNKLAVKISIGWGAIILHCILVFWCIFMIAMVIIIYLLIYFIVLNIFFNILISLLSLYYY